MRALALLLAAPLAHWLYLLLPDWDWEAQWAQWIAGHGVSAISFLVFGDYADRNWSGWRRWMGVVGSAGMIFEDAQCVVCGSLQWGWPNGPAHLHLCRDASGPDPYMVVLCAALALVAVRGIRLWTRPAQPR